MVCTWGSTAQHLHNQSILTFLETSHVNGTQAIIRVINTRSQVSCYSARTEGSEEFSKCPRITQLVRVAREPRSLETRPSLRVWGGMYERACQAWACRTWGRSQPKPARPYPALKSTHKHIHVHLAFRIRRPNALFLPQDGLYWPLTAAGSPAPNCLPLGSRLFSIDSQKADKLLVTEN